MWLVRSLFLLVCVPLAECVDGNPTHPTISSESGTSDDDSMASLPLDLGNQMPTDIIETSRVDDNSAEPDLENPAGDPNLHDHINEDSFVSYQPVEDPENREFLASRLREETNLFCQRPDYSIPSFSSLDISSEQRRDARHGQFTTIETRISSFRNWPSSKKTQTPRQLAVAGFFYEGKSDITTCFYCGERLVQWGPDNDPLMEHIRANPECDYARQIEQNRNVPVRPTVFQHETFPGPTNNGRGQRYRGHDGRRVNLRHPDQNNDHQHRQQEPQQQQANGFSRLQEDPHVTCINDQQLPDYSTMTTLSVAEDFITLISPALFPNQQRASQLPREQLPREQLPREQDMNFLREDILSREGELGHGDHAVSTQTDPVTHLAAMGYEEERIQGVLDMTTSRDGECTVLPDTEYEARQERHGSDNGDSLERTLTTPSHGLPRDAEGRDFNTQDERESSTTSSSTLGDEERNALLDENERLRECIYCRICWVREAQCLIIQCGHLLCEECFKFVTICPFCRGRTRAFVCIRRG